MSQNHIPMSRRGFVQGAGAVAAGAVALGSSAALADEAAGWDAESDILVIGSGYAGMCAAIEAATAGCSVTLIEKNTVYGGNSILCAGNAQFGGGNVVQEAAEIDDDPERFYNEIFAYGKHRAIPALLHTFVDHSNECVEWLQNDLGIVFRENVTQNEGHSVPCSLMPDESPNYPGKGGISYWYAMYTKATELGVQMLLEHKATELVQADDGTVIGAVVETPKGTKRFQAKKAVILGSGGWKSNVAMRLQWDPRLNSDLSAGGLPYVQTTGEMINEAVNIGAGTTDMSFVCEFRFKWGTKIYQAWDPVSIDNPPATGTGMTFKSFNNVVMVKADGTRFVNENAAKEYPQEPFYEAYLNQESPRMVWAVIDSAVAEELGWDVGALSTPDEAVKPFLAPEYVAVADTLEDLATQMGVPTDAFVDQIATYNGYVEGGTDEEFGKQDMTAPIATAPFYAVRMQFFAHDQMGGILANTKAQVCKRSQHFGPDPIALDDQEVIPHLYAAGECVGGYVGEDRGHGKISIYMVFGRIAGQNAALETPVA